MFGPVVSKTVDAMQQRVDLSRYMQGKQLRFIMQHAASRLPV